ncbi:CRISPR-associated protein, Csx6 family [Desulfovibrio legallii]|jgi:CRISPR-associated protein Csx14|uniref:CRISPR-associated protein, Csx6 family n=1 Tax=Desulfovibrio legallii TaxID=571438 RepID=A0A1G7LLK8_9BACT|nr:CRISPR-associated protein, Csx6 family [Desulfovibrio legallii]
MPSVLLAVCGLRPQIFTETLYALHQTGDFPRRAIILTTQQGAALSREILLGAGGRIAAFLRDYRLPSDANPLVERDILVPYCRGHPVEDITTKEESEAFQELAMRQAWEWTLDTSGRVNFSLAGGRKTMSASLALAAQCYGRQQDRLFHVLAAPHCEADVQFFYPPPGTEGSAHVILAPVPFPRLRSRLPASFLRQPCRPQDLLDHFSLSDAPDVHVYIRERHLTINARGCTLPPALFALFLWFVRHKKEFPCNGWCASCCGRACFTESSSLLADASGIARLYTMVRASDAAASSTGILDLNQENFMAYKAKLNRRLHRDLGALAAYAAILSLGRRPGVRYGLSAIQSSIHIH